MRDKQKQIARQNDWIRANCKRCNFILPVDKYNELRDIYSGSINALVTELLTAYIEEHKQTPTGSADGLPEWAKETE